jgi:hypothetical protein
MPNMSNHIEDSIIYHIEPCEEEKSENPKLHNYFLEPCHVVLGQY